MGKLAEYIGRLEQQDSVRLGPERMEEVLELLLELRRKRRELTGAKQQIAELRAELEDRYTIEPRWDDPDAPDDGRLRPDYYRLVDRDGNDVDIEVDGSELVDWVIERAQREAKEALSATYELWGVWPDGDEQLDVIPDRIVLIDEGGERADFFVVDGRPLLNAVIDRAEARAFAGPFSVWAIWGDGEELPDDYGLSDPDGDPIDVELSAAGLIDEVRRRQAKKWCDSFADGEGPQLEQLLALVPEGATLTAEEPLTTSGWDVRWELYREDAHERGDITIGQRVHSSLPAAMRSASLELLGLDEGSLRRRVTGSPAEVLRRLFAWADADRGTSDHECAEAKAKLLEAVEELRGAPAEPRPKSCRSCVHFERDAPPAVSGDTSARPCIAHDSLLAHPDGGVECEDYEPDTDPAPGSDEPAEKCWCCEPGCPEGDDDPS